MRLPETQFVRRLALVFLAALPSLGAAQGFGLYEHGTCTMGRAGAVAAKPCPDGSAIFFNPAGLAGLGGGHLALGGTFIQAFGKFTDDAFAQSTELDNPLIPIPNAYFSYAVSPKATVGIGVYAPYGLETHWPTDFDGRFLGYNSQIRSIYVQPTVGYQIHERVKVGIGLAYIFSDLELNQRLDLSAQPVPGLPGATFYNLGIPFGTDFADAHLTANGTGFAVNFGAIVQLTDRLSIGGRWITRKTISYDGDAVFEQLATGITLPAGNPLGAPAGTPMDVVLLSQFGATGALADGPVGTEITLPPQGNLGLAYEATDRLTLLADYQLVVWGWFNALNVDFQRYANDVASDFTLYEGYRDTHGIRLGAEYRHSDQLTVRAGVLHHGGAAPDETVTPLLPEGQRNEVTLGLTAHLTPSIVADFAYQYVKQNDRRGRIYDASVGNTGVYAFGAHLVGVGLSFTF